MSFDREEMESADEYYIMAKRVYVRKRDEYRRRMPLLLAERDAADGGNRTAGRVGSGLDRQIAALEEEMTDATVEWRYVRRCLSICTLTDVRPR